MRYWITVPDKQQIANTAFEWQLNTLENSRMREAREALAKFNNIWSVVLLVTDECNAHCEICLRYRETEPALQFSEMCEIVEILKRFDVKRISFTGGEPLLNPFLPELLRYAHEQGLITSLSTNGTKVTQEFVDAASDVLSEIIIPFNGSTAEIFSEIVPYGNAEHLDNLKILFQYIAENSTISLKAITVAAKPNLVDLPNIAHTLSALGVKIWKIDEWYEVQENAHVAWKYKLTKAEFATVLADLKRAYPELKIIYQEVEQRENNEVFLISSSGQVAQNNEHTNRSIGRIFDQPSSYLSNQKYYSNTPTANYVIDAAKQSNLSAKYMYQFYETQKRLLDYVSAAGQTKVFAPHTDYGANILVPQYLRSAIYQDFQQYCYPALRDDYYEINPDLYSIGLYPLGKHLTDAQFYRLENIWQNTAHDKLTVTGPFWGEGCIFYLAVPEQEVYFSKLKSLFQDNLGHIPRPTTDDSAVGWINVARTRRPVPANIILAWQQNNGNKVLGSFYPTRLGTIKADWHENIYDLESAVIE
ncbi:MAG: radical SAM protein [Heliobacteriaceae bacterium]|jgi:molybdenum cofactor biosynthesis enzyme MoaA|nr:radical SAM protein [Heliobacteriaceae bacterium]